MKITKKSFSKVVKVKYNDLVSIHEQKNFKSFNENVKNAYGFDGLGLIVVEDVPNHWNLKYNFLKQTHELVNLSSEELLSLEKPEVNYGIGWSRGKENYESVPDDKKGSFYAKLHQYNEVYNKNNPYKFGSETYKVDKSKLKNKDINIWPKSIPSLENNFHAIGNQMRNIGIILSDLIDNFIKGEYSSYSVNMGDVIRDSDTNTGRLLHYYPRGENTVKPGEMWCGWHNDHGALTSLCSAIFFNHKNEVVNDKISLPKSGLWIQDRKGEYHKIAFSKDSIAFQIGETYQILSGGKLYATPHAVILDNDIPSDVHRSTFALFMEPRMDYVLNIPKESNIKDVNTHEIYNVPKLQNRFKNNMTFKQFNDITIGNFH